MCEYGTLKSVKVNLRRGKGKRENKGGDKPNQGTLYAYVECHKETPSTTLLY
jgi:hypothetical protein